jgi:hypothetical protein
MAQLQEAYVARDQPTAEDQLTVALDNLPGALAYTAT